jgi:Thioredoxin like C-terminal domain
VLFVGTLMHPYQGIADTIVQWIRRSRALTVESAAHSVRRVCRPQRLGLNQWEQRLYQLIRQPQPTSDREFEIEFLDPGVAVFAFTFG